MDPAHAVWIGGPQGSGKSSIVSLIARFYQPQEGRILVDGKGAEDPVADNARPRGRLANRRVEIKLYVPAR